MPFDLRTFANRVISQYVYGKDAAPTSLTVAEAEALIADRASKHKANFADEERLVQASHIDISFNNYMDVVGPFVSPAQSILIQKFFELDFSDLVARTGKETFSKSEIIAEINRLDTNLEGELGLNFGLR